jgi:glutamate synthase domain-containing protein 1
MDALTRRAQAMLNDTTIDPQSRAIIRYAMEINDPWLAEFVRRADAGEEIGAPLNIEEMPEVKDDDSNEEKIEALTELICRAGDEPGTQAAALLVLMATVENSSNPKALANMAKHLAFTRCAELNLYGMVETQIVVAEGQLLAGDTLIS